MKTQAELYIEAADRALKRGYLDELHNLSDHYERGDLGQAITDYTYEGGVQPYEENN